MAELQVEIWENHIVGGIFAANPHMDKCVNADQHVLQGKVVHIPQAGAAPKAVKNRIDLPAKVVRRKDTDVLTPSTRLRPTRFISRMPTRRNYLTTSAHRC